MDDSIRVLIEIQTRSYDRAGSGIRESYPRTSAMDAARLAAFLERKVYAVLATGRPDGRPHAAPIAFSVWGGAFWIATVAGTRLRNLRARPFASIVVADGDVRAQHRAVIAEGPVVIHDGSELAGVSAEFAEDWRARHGSLPAWAAALLELRPERVFSFDGTLEAP
ncbi:MAG TPA: pyridoxamine 5'-phosphate oxidase family protein [bacterium]|nr:pyridoxamine 5'-phosphate oxidase family protein [bacterium]